MSVSLPVNQCTATPRCSNDASASLATWGESNLPLLLINVFNCKINAFKIMILEILYDFIYFSKETLETDIEKLNSSVKNK
jgi:hypothetical protein